MYVSEPCTNCGRFLTVAMNQDDTRDATERLQQAKRRYKRGNAVTTAERVVLVKSGCCSKSCLQKRQAHM